MGRDYLKSNKNKWESILPFDLFYVFIMIVASSCYCSLSKAKYTKKLILYRIKLWDYTLPVLLNDIGNRCNSEGRLT